MKSQPGFDPVEISGVSTTSQTLPCLEARELGFLYVEHPLVIGCLLGKGGRNEDL